MASRLVDATMKTSQKKHHKSAIRVIEEAVHILRMAPGTLLCVYYLGSVPFVLGLLYFWADMSRSANANEYSAAAALGLAFLFVWMKVWHTVFAYQVRAQIYGEIRSPWSLQRVTSIAATQSLIQSTRIFVIPIASLMVVPFGFCYAFYQNVTVHDEGEGQKLKTTCIWAGRQAKLWPRQNHLLIGIFWLFGLIIFTNISIAAVIAPQLIKTLFGIDSVFTLSGTHLFLNTTFWASMMGITYLMLDPFIKTSYVLRCFYGSALQSGEDLKTQLNEIRTNGKKLVAGLLIVSLCAVPFASLAAQHPSVTPAELDRSIEKIMDRREFSWRMPRENLQPEEQEAKGPLEAAVEWLIEMLGEGFKKIGKWIIKFIKWLESFLPKPDGRTQSSSGSWVTPVRVVLIILLTLLLAVLAYVFVRIWRQRRPGPVEAIRAVADPTPDLSDESIKADDLSTNRWLTLAGELVEKGKLRLAMRALYLATLAHLAERDLITIEVYKSNREYERELKRRAHEHQDLLSIFSNSLNLFERVWYGMYRIVKSDFDDFAAKHQRIVTFAKR